MPEPHDQGEHLIGLPLLGLVAKSLYLQVHDVLTTHRSFKKVTTVVGVRFFPERWQARYMMHGTYSSYAPHCHNEC